MQKVKAELVNLLRGAVAAAIVGLLTALVNYGGHHMSAIISSIAMIVGGYGGVKATSIK